MPAAELVRSLWPIHLTGVALVGRSPRSSCGWAFQGRRMAADSWGLAGRLFWLRLGDQVAVAHGVVIDGELEDPVEQQAATAGTAAVETEHELVEVVGQVGVVDGALMGAQQPPFGQ
jgi:hypothetical protein